jgi:hypothetical protein
LPSQPCQPPAIHRQPCQPPAITHALPPSAQPSSQPPANHPPAFYQPLPATSHQQATVS